ncbi:hypothetical protein [Methylogaea oryzae]|uniref:hypothetical protein n=1 Tax=Methylogaea oryzae TaxID=1295382 RepID=UPI0006D1C4AF|nr:hypothetical protein [Methylogaea oryzae]
MGLLLFLAYLGYLDYTVRYQFQGQRWELPSYVYARPLELYAGAPVTPERLQATLDDLHYRLDTRLTTPASYVRRGDEFWLSSRPFRFWDKEEANRRVKVVLEGGRVAAMQDLANGKDAALVRLDRCRSAVSTPAARKTASW